MTVPATTMLQTCKLIEWEATPVLKKTARFFPSGIDCNPFARLIVRPEGLALLSSQYNFLEKTCQWCVVLTREERDQISFVEFQIQQDMTTWGVDLLDWIQISGRALHTSKRCIPEVIVIVNSDPTSCVSTLAKVYAHLEKSEVLAALDTVSFR